MNDVHMRPEPEVLCNGATSDESEHAPMLANDTANAMADELAIRQAVEAGLSREEAESLVLPQSTKAVRAYNKADDVLQGSGVTPTQASLQDFWRWAFSDLCDDDLKGIFAEWIVIKLLGISSARRISWANSDIFDDSGVTIEIKATSYWQSWKLIDGFGIPRKQVKLCEDSKIAFHGLMARTADEVAKGSEERRLKSDLYVFAFQHEKEHARWDAMDLAQWEFYVLPAVRLNSRSISLQALREMGDAGAFDAPTFSVRVKALLRSLRDQKPAQDV